MPINTLADLLDIKFNGLVLDHATMSLDDGVVTISGGATAFGLPDAKVTASFSVKDSALTGRVDVTLASLTLKQMDELKLLPKSVYEASALPSQAFTNVRLKADTAARHVTVQGDGPAGTLDLGISALPISNSLIHLELSVPAAGDPENLEAWLDGSLQLGQGGAVRVDLPRSFRDWQLSLKPDSDVALSGGLADVMALTNTDAASLLPSTLALSSGFKLSALAVQFSSSRSLMHSIRLSVVTPSWTILDADTLSISQVILTLNISNYDLKSITGEVIATLRIFGVDVKVKLPIPFSGSDWYLESYPNILIPGIGDIVTEAGKLVGTGDLNTSLPSGLSDLGSLIVEYLRVDFNPIDGVLSRVSFRLASANEWKLPYADSISLADISLDLSIAHPLIEKKREVTGSLGATMWLGDLYIPVIVERVAVGEGWTLRIVYDNISLGLEDLMPLVGISADDFRKALPDNLSIVSDIYLSALSIAYDFTAQKLSYASFALALDDTWKVIPGYLEVNSLNLFVASDARKSVIQSGIQVTMGAEVEVIGVGFELGASNLDPIGEWLLTLSMREGDSISFNALANSLMGVLLPGDFKLPATLPTVVCTEAELTLAPASGAFHGSLTSDVTWPIPFAHTSFEIKHLNTTLDIADAPEDPATPRPYAFAASGEFAFLGIAGAASFVTGNTGADTTIAVTISNSAEAVKLPTIAKALTTGTQDGNETWSGLLPTMPAVQSDFGTLTLDLRVNLTQNTFLLYGQSSKYGSIGFLAKKTDEANWGFLVAARVAKEFTFASLMQDLSPIDSVFSFADGGASIAYSSIPADSIQSITSTMPEMSKALTVGAKSEPLQTGFNFYAALNFGAAQNRPLLGNVSTMLSGVDRKPDLTLYGYISKSGDGDNSTTKALFRAELGTFSVLDLFQFERVAFQYSLDRQSEVTLSGDLTFVFDRGGPSPRVFAYRGDLKISETRADFAVTTVKSAPDLTQPLGMTGVSIKDVRLVFSHVFRTVEPAAPAVTTLELSGSAKFGSETDFAAGLYFINTDPVLVEVSLARTKPLGIIAFLSSSVAGVTYPPEYFDIKFISGSAYYYKKTADTTNLYAKVKTENNGEIARVNGFNLQTTLSIFDRTVSLAANIQSDGLTASGKMLKSIDLGFAEFTDSDFTGSPSLFLRVLTKEKAFGMKAGFKFFQEPFATGELSIGKYTGSGNDEAQFRGHLAYAGNIDLFRGSAIGFSYSQSEGFKITDWPLSLQVPLDYNKLMNGFSTGGCSALVGMVFAQAVKTDFSVKPSFSTDATDYILTLQGTYSVALIDASHPFLQVALPDIPVHIKRSQQFSLSSLPQLIVNTILDSAPAIVGKILNDPAKFSLFVSTVGLVKASQALLGNLVCNGAKGAKEALDVVNGALEAQQAAEDALVAARNATTLEELESAVAAAARAALRGATLAGGTGGGSAAAAAAAAAATAAATAAGLLAAWLLKDKDGPKKPDAPQLDKAVIASFIYDGSQLAVSWSQVSNAAVYSVELLSGKDVAASRDLPANVIRTTFPVNNLSAGVYSIQVRANAPQAKESVSDPATITVLGKVTVTLAASGAKLQASWSGIDSPVFEILLIHDGATATLPPVSATSYTFDPSGPGAYAIKVRAKGDSAHVPGPWSDPSNPVVVSPDAITVSLTCSDGQIAASWNDVQAPKYEVTLYKESIGTATKESATNSETFDPIGPGAYTVTVRALGDGTHLPGALSSPSNTVYAPFETNVTLRYDFNISKLAATWNAVFPPPYPGFSAHLFKDGQEIVKRGVDGLQTNFDHSGPGIYTVCVQQLGDSTHFPSQLSKPSQPVTVAGEVTVTLAYQNEKIVVTWNDLKAPNYNVELLKDDKLFTSTTTMYTRTEFNVRSGAGIYTARVHPNGRTNFFGGDWSKFSNPLTQLNPPSGASVSTEGEDKVFVACQYEGDCFDAQLAMYGAPFGAIATSVKGQPAQPLSAKGLAAGEYWVRLRSRYQDDRAVPSDWIYTRAPFYRLSAPTIASISLSTDRLKRGFVIVELQSTAPNAQRYFAQFVMAAHREPTGTVLTFRNANIELPSNDLAMGTYQVQVRAGRDQNDGFVSDWALSTMTLDLPAAAFEKNSLRLDGNGSAVIPLASPLDLDDCTVEAWVNTSEGGRGATVFNCDGAFGLSVVDGAIVFEEVRGLDSAGWKSPAQAADGKWHHVAAVRRKSGVQLYLDGNPARMANAGQIFGPLTCKGRITIGALQPDNGNNRFIGMLGELRIWNRARETHEIQQTMRTVLDPMDPTLLLYYNFRNGAGRELTGRGADLLLQGSAEIVRSEIPVVAAS
jgi:concanavalin A-like lectin/glucanase superfamily protein